MDKQTDFSLYIVSTPIGNMGDISGRALEVLSMVDFILCEDTRQSVKLLNHYEIKNKLYSFHKFNENEISLKVINELKSGKRAALISDAGTPLISDPGFPLVKLMIENDISFSVIPGANALLPALIYSGMMGKEFKFVGFLPKKKSARKEKLLQEAKSNCPVVFYASNHELKELLVLMDEIMPKRYLSLSKEITKLFEKTFRGCARDILNSFGEEEIKGEYVLVVSPMPEEIVPHKSIEERYGELMGEGIPEKDAMKIIAKERGVSKSDIYAVIKKK